jgi:hypothetical protein
VLPAASDADRRFKIFLVAGLSLWHVYVLKVGGDFMYGRFLVTAIPLLLLAVEQLVGRNLGPRPSVSAVATLALALATMGGTRIIPDRDLRWHMANEASYYQISAWSPSIVIESDYYVAGQQLREWVHDRGLRPRVATMAIGQVGFYSRLELVDLAGLTDPLLARQPLDARSRPGHEKRASAAYIRQRGAVIAKDRLLPPPTMRGALHLRGFPAGWHMVRYDATLVAGAPELGLPNIDTLLSRYLEKMRGIDPRRIAQQLRWLDAFYFDQHPGDARRAEIRAHLDAHGLLR